MYLATKWRATKFGLVRVPQFDESLKVRTAMDHTEREHLIQELQRREAYLAEAQRLSHTGSFGWKISTNEIFWSEETFQIFQYDRTLQPTPELIRRRIHPEDEALVEQTFQDASAKGTDVDFEHRLVMPDGSVKHVHVLARAMRDRSGDTEYVGAVMDVTAWRRTEDELRKSEEKYRDLVELSPDAIYVRDENGLLVSANPLGLELLGRTAEEAAGMSTAESYLPEELALYQRRLEKINAGERLRFERTFLRKDGTQVPVEVLSSSMRHGCSQVVMRDISERKRAETKLRRSEAYLAEAQRLSRTGSWAGRADLTASTYWSDELFRLLGFPIADNPPSNEEVESRFTPETSARMSELWENIRQKKTTCDGEFPMRLPDGSDRIIRIVAHPVFDEAGEIVEFFGTTIDITEQRQSQAELERALSEITKSEDRLRTIIDTIPNMVWSTQPNGSAEFLNRGWLDFAGLSGEEARGWGWKHVVHPDDSNALMDKWLESIATGNPFEAEARFRRADGQYRWVLCRGVPLRDELGNIVQWYGTNTDIEERKQAEDALRKAQTELAHLTRVMTMGELVASIAHEVNQPLGAIVTNGHACVRLLSRPVPDLQKSREVIGRMINDGMRASEVIKRIRELMHKTPAEKARLQINDTIAEVIALVSSDVQRSEIELQTELEADLPLVFGDRIQLQQVILNLILNAKDAMSGEQVHPRELQISTRMSNANTITVAVRDTGHGLKWNDIERIFDPFFTTKADGMGLGLSISRTIIEAHGGTLSAIPNEGKGATIKFSLPLKPASVSHEESRTISIGS